MESTEALPRDRGFHLLRVRRIIDETRDARSILFEVPAVLADAFRYQAGQFLTLEVPVDGVTLRRCYSLASAPHEGEHRVTVKRVAGGRVSNQLCESLRVDDELAVKPPEGRFVLTGTEAPLSLFAGGSGITPVISLLKSALVETRRPIRLFYANRTERAVIFRDELDGIARAHADRVEIMHHLDDVHGLVTRGVLRGDASEDHYVCGPAPFMDAVERALGAAGVDPQRVHVERFVSPADPGARVAVADAADGDTPALIEISLKGRRASVPYTPGTTILRAALDAGMDAPYSCDEGFCGCCVAQLTEGQVVMAADDALTADEKRRGLVLTCQARPRSRRCAVEYLDG